MQIWVETTFADRRSCKGRILQVPIYAGQSSKGPSTTARLLFPLGFHPEKFGLIFKD